MEEPQPFSTVISIHPPLYGGHSHIDFLEITIRLPGPNPIRWDKLPHGELMLLPRPFCLTLSR